MSVIHIRQAKEADLPLLLGLYGNLSTGPGERIAPAKARRIFRRMELYPFYKIFLAFSGPSCVGVFSLLVMDNLAHGGRSIGIVENVVVAKGWRRRGVGGMLMAKAREIARRRKCYKVVLSSNKRRRGSHRFYRDLGFELHGYSYGIAADEER
jgi:GNAT superfamily N-acetyltransferase